MKHGSLFSGIGGFDLGFERASIETVWQVEIDEYCRRVLARRFPSAKRYVDIRDCCGIQGPHTCHRKHHLTWVDILSGGFPCQDISNAGKRAGIDGDRSGLWSEYARIIRELRPRNVVVENVAALLGRGMERVLGDLATCGYDAEWQSIRASDVGAPHRRERIWIVAYSRGQQYESGCSTVGGETSEELSTNPAGTRTRKLSARSRREGQGASDAYGGREELVANSNTSGQRRENASDEINRSAIPRGRDAFHVSRSSGTVSDSAKPGLSYGPILTMGQSEADAQLERSDWWATEPDVGRVAHGVSARVDRLRGLGNAIVPQIAEWIGRRLIGT